MSANTTGRFAAEQGDILLRAVTARIARAIRSPGVSEVHDLRVAIRRFRHILVVLKPCFPHGESRRIRRGLKQIMVQAGAVRDHDTAMRLLTKVALPGSGQLVDEFREEREQAARTLTTSLRRWVQRNLPARWRQAQESAQAGKGADARFCGVPVDAAARRILPAMARETFHCGKDAAHHDASIEEIHGFRVAAKNLRYALECFASLYGADLPGLVGQLRDVQDLLGDVHDCAVVRRMVSRRQALNRKDGGEAGTKEILSVLKKRQRKKAEEFRERYSPEFSSPAVLRKWKESLRHTAAPLRSPRKTAV